MLFLSPYNSITTTMQPGDVRLERSQQIEKSMRDIDAANKQRATINWTTRECQWNCCTGDSYFDSHSFIDQPTICNYQPRNEIAWRYSSDESNSNNNCRTSVVFWVALQNNSSRHISFSGQWTSTHMCCCVCCVFIAFIWGGEYACEEIFL